MQQVTGAVPTGYALGVFISPIVAGTGLALDQRNGGNPEARFYCSELVALAFESAGVPLGDRGASTAPGDIAKCHVLSAVGDLQRGASLPAIGAPRLKPLRRLH